MCIYILLYNYTQFLYSGSVIFVSLIYVHANSLVITTSICDYVVLHIFYQYFSNLSFHLVTSFCHSLQFPVAVFFLDDQGLERGMRLGISFFSLILALGILLSLSFESMSPFLSGLGQCWPLHWVYCLFLWCSMLYSSLKEQGLMKTKNY